MPLDGSRNSIRGLKFALDVAKQSGMAIIGLNVDSSQALVDTLPVVRSKIKQKSKEIIEEARAMSQNGNVPFTGVSKTGDNIGRTIVAFAERRKVDVIILGSRGPDPEIELFLGSVANHVVNKSKIPVTVVK